MPQPSKLPGVKPRQLKGKARPAVEVQSGRSAAWGLLCHQAHTADGGLPMTCNQLNLVPLALDALNGHAGHHQATASSDVIRDAP